MSTLPPLPTVLFCQSSDPEFNGAAARSGDLGLEAGATGERPAYVSRWSAELPMLQFSEEYGRGTMTDRTWCEGYGRDYTYFYLKNRS
jgi:hypothetical protein